MQNEELRRAQAELDDARARYFDLYDLAPVGYCTLSEQGLILETNLTAVILLGVPRGALVKQPISRFILKEDHDIYYLHRNYNVASVSSGEEAMAYLQDHQADLIILDMIMDPGMDGLDTYKQVLEIRPKQKAIIVSGFSESDRVLAAKGLGAGAYVRKPYITEKLGLAVRKELADNDQNGIKSE
jgi:CheY-like chemotaxis protein